ncbi:peptidoglycan recognition protein family protein [Salegentibacter salegens]|uniref:N-acetylmuramoyl-L-alanine amidase n=1 Tax=Salegentibacter salegens TaxID=143223 RepID=A0A1M7I3L8_9FLAO|nr:peptidoglycan recognition family protein [Salegentibacter salegens]PRX42867.1 N-acetylmuramoyl-L-alanine amidase [Salegentibacter salegens]SHM35153.1 N-acetylmuramoyl-L-alanine amidase [Salegentibacter salegens]
MRYVLIIFTIFLFSCKSADISEEIIDRPIIFNEERKQLSLDYLKARYDLEQSAPEIIPKMIVLHWTAIPDLESSFRAFNPVKLPGAREDIQEGGALNVSAHFLVDRDGIIYRLMPETTMARHVIGLNHAAIGVENVGGTKTTPLTKAQLKANIDLVKYLSEKYNIEYLLGHYEYPQFEGHELWLEKDKSYRTQKTDPGKDFMQKVREKTKNLNFKPVPKNQ